ncbi:hypothetical protein [Paraburkholderia phytofirmans]|uniref:Uncharacterized protein n=1 Tax=Paraburkholderia phytofirmans (strain DSM 17436 / LMG 22146 / PsJN) TaxID=398527 RepID=B2T9Q4_PARPJ|nr:hypothetical protein [Paraburkholderia phytofirmans]ACD21156.1 conserved hypothetical protein [Paraburkholderia phytofirmans PsJN]
MNRPLALIEGDLALPIPLPFDALPPPFGSWRRQGRTAAQREPHPAAAAVAQQAIQNAMRRPPSTASRGPVPPGARFLFFYKLPQQPDHSRRFDEQLAEARYYLEMGRARPSSTRSDHLLGAAIFASCSIALAWLLATCTTHDADRSTVAASLRTQSVASTDGSAMAIHPQARAKPAQPSVKFAKTTPRSAPLAAISRPNSTAPGAPTSPDMTLGTTLRRASEPQHAEHLVPRPTGRVSTRQTAPIELAKAHYQTPVARLSKPQVDKRLALSRTTNPATQPSASKQSERSEWPEQRERPTSATDTTERAALRDWAAQQRRSNITTRASTPTPGDTDWNARMTQRRITDSPDAFQTGRAQK